jgi:hypothetical protein
MAFHQNLEADRIDGFNLFSAFVRVPLLVLNGILGNDGRSSSDDIDCDTLRNNRRCTEDGAENSMSSGNDSDAQLRVKGTDCSNQLMQRRQPSNTSTMAHSGTTNSSESLTDTCNSYNNSEIKRTKRMSWSDESGLPLVWENDEVRRENLLIRFYLNCLYSTATVCRLVDDSIVESVSSFGVLKAIIQKSIFAVNELELLVVFLPSLQRDKILPMPRNRFSLRLE